MKVLLRNFDGKRYEWKDAEFVNDHFKVDGQIVLQTNIVSITDDNRGEYVKCSKCGQTFKKNSPEIEAHKNRYKDINNCFSCQYLARRNARTTNTQYVLQSDGRYKLVAESICDLYCQYQSWLRGGRTGINSEETRNMCVLKVCESADMVEIEDIFTKNPGIFDDIITVDKIIAKGYREMVRYPNSTIYSLKGRNNIKAHVNNLGIVDSFEVQYRNHNWKLTYSKALDELYDMSGREYVKWNHRDVSDNTRQYIKKKISELYN